MKKAKKTVMLIATLFAGLFFIISCDNMNDIQSKFVEREEQVYLGRVDSIKSFPGFVRAKITWYIGADPKIDKTIIYWNLRRDSIVKDFTRTTPGVQKDSIIIEDLLEGTSLFEFRNTNNKGETSLYSSVSVRVWGDNFADNLYARKLTSLVFDYERSNYKLDLSPTTLGDSVLYSEIIYMNAQGAAKTIKIERETNGVELTDFTDGAEFRFRNVFFLPQGIDTVYQDYKSYRAPKARFEKGEKITLKGNKESKYSERDGKTLYEWNAAGDLIVYAMNEDGSLSKTKNYVAIAPRTIYRDFFFYSDDLFIGVGISNKVSMHRIVNDQLVFVKTPKGEDTFGGGFNMKKFLPANGFFFSVADGNLRTWFAKNDATWGSPNGTTVGQAFIYEPVVLFNYHNLIGVDADGYLWSIPISTIGGLGVKNKIGSGWNRFKKIVSIGTKLLCLDDNDDFYEFDFNATDYYWVLE